MKHKFYILSLPAILFFCLLLNTKVGAQAKATLSDPQIASVAVVANQVDIQAGELARQKSKNEAVRQFAQTMITDHQSVIAQATALVKKLNVTPESNALGRQLAAQGQKTRRTLRSKSGRSFDKAYIDNEVAYHKAVIAAVNDTLIPQSQNGELKALLQSVLPVLRTHLEHAEMVQKQLGGK